MAHSIDRPPCLLYAVDCLPTTVYLSACLPGRQYSCRHTTPQAPPERRKCAHCFDYFGLQDAHRLHTDRPTHPSAGRLVPVSGCTDRPTHSSGRSPNLCPSECTDRPTLRAARLRCVAIGGHRPTDPLQAPKVTRTDKSTSHRHKVRCRCAMTCPCDWRLLCTSSKRPTSTTSPHPTAGCQYRPLYTVSRAGRPTHRGPGHRSKGL